MMFLYVVGGILLVIIAAVLILGLPDILRYIRINKM